MDSVEYFSRQKVYPARGLEYQPAVATIYLERRFAWKFPGKKAQADPVSAAGDFSRVWASRASGRSSRIIRCWRPPRRNPRQAAAANKTVSGNIDIVLNVNGQDRKVTVEPRTTLLNALRNNMDPPLTGPKLVCDMGTCGVLHGAAE